MLFNYKFYTMKEFKDENDDIKWDIYSELVEDFMKKCNEVKRQYELIVDKDKQIELLKQLIHDFINNL